MQAGRQAGMQAGRQAVRHYFLQTYLLPYYYSLVIDLIMLRHKQPVSHLRRWPSIKPTNQALCLVFTANSLDKSAA